MLSLLLFTRKNKVLAKSINRPWRDLKLDQVIGLKQNKEFQTIDVLMQQTLKQFPISVIFLELDNVIVRSFHENPPHYRAQCPLSIPGKADPYLNE